MYVQGAIVVDNILYVPTTGSGIYALNPLDGSEIWWVSGGSMHAGVAVEGDLIYGTASWSLKAFNRFTGVEIWSYSTSPGIHSTPAVAYGNVYVQADNGYFHSVNKDTGSLVWKYDLNTNNWNGIKSSPAVGFDKVFVGGQKGGNDFFCFNAHNGALIWSYELAGTVISSPVISGNGIVYIGTSTLYAFDVNDGTLIWSYGLTGSSARASPAIYNEVIYIPTVSVMYAIGVYTGPPSDNQPPIADAGELYIEEEGEKITFDASASSDPDGDALSYRWDFNGDSVWDTSWSSSPFAEYTWGDDYNGDVILEVSDGEFQDTDIAVVIVNNVAPIGGINGIYLSDEGLSFTFSAEATDQGSDDLTFLWELEYGPSISKVYFNNGIDPDPYPSPFGTFPFSAIDSFGHTYGDDAVYSVSLTISDDDGGYVVYTTAATIQNTAPIIEPFDPIVSDEGSPFMIITSTLDYGSDDLTFTWDFEFGPTITNIYYNNGIDEDPDPSPEGVFPFIVEDMVEHTYGDNGIYKIVLTVTDDDGGIASFTTNIIVNNVAPIIEPLIPQTLDEGSLLTLSCPAFDFGSDDLTFSWQLDYGPNITNTYFNDGATLDLPCSPWGTYPMEMTDSVTHCYGDNGNYSITLTVADDDGGSAVSTSYINVNNVIPTIENIEANILVNFTLRVAGEKWHDVKMYILADGSEIGYAEVERNPGDPDEQSVTVSDVKCDVTKLIEIRLSYTPMDDPLNGQINGGTPVWVIMNTYKGDEVRCHHTCNVLHPDTWEWRVNINQQLIGHEITLEASAKDIGSDDLQFQWSFGSIITYYNDGLKPDPYPSPDGVFPFFVMDSPLYFYNGSETISLSVIDDDGGTAISLIDII
jgi:outer membrane protein assembly factor BamB